MLFLYMVRGLVPTKLGRGEASAGQNTPPPAAQRLVGLAYVVRREDGRVPCAGNVAVCGRGPTRGCTMLGVIRVVDVVAVR